MATLHKKDYTPHARGPLHGVRVVDLSRLVAGNMLTLQLADFGADVIKIEPLKGDTLRAFRVNGIETFWKAYARNKKSVCLDLRRPEAIELVAQLASQADVLVESFRPGVIEKMGLGPEVLLRLNPRLVIARISGWGQTGPYKHKPGFGTLVEGYSGFAAMNGFADREPVLPPMFLGDMATGLYGASAVMTALWNVRVNQGEGQVIDLSLFEPTLSILGPHAANFKLTGTVKERTGSRSSTTAPRNAYQTFDKKWVCLSTSTQTMAERLFIAIGRADMNSDHRFSSNASRLANVEEVEQVVREFISQKTLEETLALFDQAGVTIGPICDASQLVNDRYVIERESIVEVGDEELGLMPVHNIVPRLQGTPGSFRMPAPVMGQHSAELLGPLLEPAIYLRLVQSGVIIEAGSAGSTAADMAAVANV
jgi:crotonobetainyl-CoA:carnitine CoA-transferase CaiB-like acyl-CoA transferase